MASVTGSRLAFFANNGNPVQISLNGAGPTVSGAFNLEVFTTAAGSLTPGFQGSAFIQGATQIDANTVQAGSLGSTEQILQGGVTVVDQTGGQNIDIVGSGAGGDFIQVVGSAGDTVTGSSVTGNTQLIDASGTNALANPGAMTITGGAGQTTVWAGSSDSITGGAGALQVAGNAGNNNTIAGGAGDLAAFNFGTGNSITGSSSGSTFVDDNYGASGGINNTIVGGSGAGPVTNPLGGTFSAGTWIVAGTNDQITGGSGTTFVNATERAGSTITGGGGATTVWAGAGESITGGSGGLTLNAGSGSTMSGGAGNLLAFNFGTGNNISGATASGANSFIDDSYTNPTAPGSFTGGSNTITGGGGATTVIAGPTDSIIGGAGAVEASFKSALTGNETVDLSTGTGAATLRDISDGGSGTNVTVSGFDTAGDTIASATDSGATLIASSTTDGSGNVILNFSDGSTMTLLGVTNPNSITFTS